MRSNYYPQFEDTKQVKPGQLRCGEHTDYSALTLLYQDRGGRKMCMLTLDKETILSQSTRENVRPKPPHCQRKSK